MSVCFLATYPAPPRRPPQSLKLRNGKGTPRRAAVRAGPVTVTRHGVSSAPNLQRLVYLGGLDGAPLPSAQVDAVRDYFEPVSVCPSASDRSGWDALALAVAAVVSREARESGRQVVLVGESFGAALALRVAGLDKPYGHVGRLVLVNAATALASEAFLTAFTGLLPLLRLDGSGTVFYGAAALILYKSFLVDERRLRPECIPGDGSWLARSVDIDAVPLELMLHRVHLLRTFRDTFSDSRISQLVTMPTTLVASKHDRLFPSEREARRLATLLPNVEAQLLLEQSAHACLLENGIYLTDFLNPAKRSRRRKKIGSVLTKHSSNVEDSSRGHRRRFSSTAEQETLGTTLEEVPDASFESVNSLVGTAFAARCRNVDSNPSPSTMVGYELLRSHQIMLALSPSNLLRRKWSTFLSGVRATGNVNPGDKKRRLRNDDAGMSFEQAWILGKRVLAPWRALVRPVVSGRHFVGNAMQDMFEHERPVLFVGNHGVYGFLDTPLIIEELNDLIGGPRLRAMAHDIHFEHFNDISGGRWGRFCSALGAIRATPRNFYRLLRQGEPVLLFPGGPTEVCRRRGQKNKLLWRDDTDFVRPAARMNAVIVPFSCVGADDAIDIILDGQELQGIPILGPLIRRALVDHDLDPEHVMPFGTLPRLCPFQIEFHAPIRTLDVDPSDADACRAVYKKVRSEVESGIGRLLLSQDTTNKPSIGRSIFDVRRVVSSSLDKMQDDWLC